MGVGQIDRANVGWQIDQANVGWQIGWANAVRQIDWANAVRPYPVMTRSPNSFPNNRFISSNSIRLFSKFVHSSSFSD